MGEAKSLEAGSDDSPTVIGSVSPPSNEKRASKQTQDGEMTTEGNKESDGSFGDFFVSVPAFLLRSSWPDLK